MSDPNLFDDDEPEDSAVPEMLAALGVHGPETEPEPEETINDRLPREFVLPPNAVNAGFAGLARLRAAHAEARANRNWSRWEKPRQKPENP